MAASIATVTVSRTDRSTNTLRVFGTVAIGAGTYAAGGVPVSFAGFDSIKSNSAPKYVEFRTTKSPNNGWQYSYNPGTTPTISSGKMQAFGQDGSTGPLVELAAGTTPATVTGDTIQFEAGFDYGV